jgi:integral membrane sensor domain MASE1
VVLAGLVLERISGARPLDISRPRHPAAFAAACGMLDPGASALLGAVSPHAIGGAPFWDVVLVRFPAEALGLAIITPIGLALRGANWRDVRRLRCLGLLALVVVLLATTSLGVGRVPGDGVGALAPGGLGRYVRLARRTAWPIQYRSRR